MKNPHGVEPTRFMKRKESSSAIGCFCFHDIKGPIFGSQQRERRGNDFVISFNNDLYIGDSCNREQQCYIHNDGTRGYECHPQYKSSLFVDTAGLDEDNYFSVSDYEVFCIDYKNRENINKLCKHSDIIWEYIETKDISEQSLKQVDDDVELLNDLNAIHCEDSSIRLKISSYYFKNPSEFLSDTQIVNQNYDDKLREWLGNNYKWKLIYRASQNDYTVESFHEYCDDKGPTLVIIKSSKGWIFGGYTTQSWSGECIYYDILIINRFKR